MVQFHVNEGLDRLTFGCNIPNLANICLHSFTSVQNFIHLQKAIKNRFQMFGKIWLEDRH